ncbi:hypothetical protein ACTXT7_016777 [Hymenolepis weldensis]
MTYRVPESILTDSGSTLAPGLSLIIFIALPLAHLSWLGEGIKEPPLWETHILFLPSPPPHDGHK